MQFVTVSTKHPNHLTLPGVKQDVAAQNQKKIRASIWRFSNIWDQAARKHSTLVPVVITLTHTHTRHHTYWLIVTRLTAMLVLQYVDQENLIATTVAVEDGTND